MADDRPSSAKHEGATLGRRADLGCAVHEHLNPLLEHGAAGGIAQFDDPTSTAIPTVFESQDIFCPVYRDFRSSIKFDVHYPIWLGRGLA